MSTQLESKRCVGIDNNTHKEEKFTRRIELPFRMLKNVCIRGNILRDFASATITIRFTFGVSL